VIVLDASAVVELLLDTVTGRRVAMLIEDAALGLHAPHLLDVEVVSALRRFVRDGSLDEEEAQAAIVDLLALDLERHSHEALLDRTWDLRANVTTYDAVYVALAEALDATLLTCDSRLARAPGTKTRVQLIK
jgi:predicted nucleic acid-binding protein